MRLIIITIDDAAYPARLRTIFDPPSRVYVRGELHPADVSAVAIVGARRATEYGRGDAKRRMEGGRPQKLQGNAGSRARCPAPRPPRRRRPPLGTPRRCANAPGRPPAVASWRAPPGRARWWWWSRPPKPAH